MSLRTQFTCEARLAAWHMHRSSRCCNKKPYARDVLIAVAGKPLTIDDSREVSCNRRTNQIVNASVLRTSVFMI